MTITIKQLANGQLASAKGTIYTATACTAIIKSITLVNTGGSSVTVNLYAATRRIIPKDLTLAAGYSLVVDDVITLSAGNIIEGSDGVGTNTDFVISGVEET